MKIFTNITVGRIAAPGEEALAIEPAKISNVFDALTRIYTTHNVFDAKGKPCGIASNFRLDGGQILADVELSSPEPSGKFALSILLGGMSGKAAYRAGNLYGPDVAHLVLVPDTTEATRLSLEITKTMRGSGNGAGINFASVVDDYVRRGVANPFTKAIITHPDLYNRYRASFANPADTRLSAKKPADETQLSAGDVSIMHAELRAIDRLPATDRGLAITKLAQSNPKAYNAARSRGLI